MIAVVQRVSEASVTIENKTHARIGAGLCALLAVQRGDSETPADWMARKLANLRLFADDHRNMNCSVRDIDGEILLVSQFTLAGDCTKGNRPSFDGAADPEVGRRLFDHVAHQLRSEHGLPVSVGVFGAMMQVSLVNEGPVTLIVNR